MIRQISIDELDRLFSLGEKFFASSRFLNGFNPDVARKNWTVFLSQDIGVIFVIEADGEIRGMLGGLKMPDIHSGELRAVEMFWFVDEAHRGRGLLLLKEFEKWARENGCKTISMMYLADSMPEKLKNVYERLGYKIAEVAYVKEVS